MSLVISNDTRVDTRKVGWFYALRVFAAPDSTGHMTLLSIGGLFWLKAPKWWLRRWWPEFRCGCDRCDFVGNTDAGCWIYDDTTGRMLCEPCAELENE